MKLEFLKKTKEHKIHASNFLINKGAVSSNIDLLVCVWIMF